jgi:hypothetical protein
LADDTPSSALRATADRQRVRAFARVGARDGSSELLVVAVIFLKHRNAETLKHRLGGQGDFGLGKGGMMSGNGRSDVAAIEKVVEIVGFTARAGAVCSA